MQLHALITISTESFGDEDEDDARVPFKTLLGTDVCWVPELGSSSILKETLYLLDIQSNCFVYPSFSFPVAVEKQSAKPVKSAGQLVKRSGQKHVLKETAHVSYI